MDAEEEYRRDLLRVALFAAQELRAALEEMDISWHRWFDLPRAQDILEHKARDLGLDPNNLGIPSQLNKKA